MFAATGTSFFVESNTYWKAIYSEFLGPLLSDSQNYYLACKLHFDKIASYTPVNMKVTLEQILGRYKKKRMLDGLLTKTTDKLRSRQQLAQRAIYIFEHGLVRLLRRSSEFALKKCPLPEPNLNFADFPATSPMRLAMELFTPHWSPATDHTHQAGHFRPAHPNLQFTTPLHIACFYGHIEILEYILHHLPSSYNEHVINQGLPVNTFSFFDFGNDMVAARAIHYMTPLGLCCYNGHENCARLLLLCGARIEESGVVADGISQRLGMDYLKCATKWHPIHIVAAKGNIAMFEMLMGCVADDIDTATRILQQPLETCDIATTSDFETFLFDSMAIAIIHDRDSLALHMLDKARQLLAKRRRVALSKKKVSENEPGDTENLPAESPVLNPCTAYSSDSSDGIGAQIFSGALPMALLLQKYELAKQMIEWMKDADTSGITKKNFLAGLTKSLSVCFSSHYNLDIITYLLENGANPNGVRQAQFILSQPKALAAWPLWAACSGGDVAAVELLLKHGADVSMKQAYENCITATVTSKTSPLIQRRIIRLLLENGAVPFSEETNVNQYSHVLFRTVHKNMLVCKPLIDATDDPIGALKKTFRQYSAFPGRCMCTASPPRRAQTRYS
eukprot:TRINITY_DN7510_c0_g1_i3.p1 TRINITY_DN7510_c0_g1~~TRINITY_DN7510_c0_g1_i3.p1  ORF type:complete len:620 (+),score=80.81 TRINITY_DN7510_c0_g1_i3:180-2039(+)